MVCPNCKNMLPNGSVACNRCGYSFVNNNYPNMTMQNNQNMNQGNTVNPQDQSIYRQQNNSQMQQPSQMYFQNPNYRNVNNKNNKKTSNTTLGIIGGIILFLFLLVSCFDSDDDKKSNNTEEVTTSVAVEENTEGTEEETTEEVHVVDASELSDRNIEDYSYITNEDLAKYAPNLGDQKVCFTAEVSSLYEDSIKVNLGNGFMYSDCQTTKDYSNILQEGDKILLCGTVEGQDSYGFLGNSVVIKDCEVLKVNEGLESYDTASSSDALQEYFVVTDEIANTNDVSEEEYKSVCETYSYEEILRNEDEYKGKHVVISGKVDQVIEGLLGGYSIYITDSSGNKWHCTYRYKDGESKILENDNVTVYGDLNGTANSKTVLGKQVTMPYVEINYYE